MLPMIDHALHYAARGWRVIPLHTVVHGVCSCKAGAACKQKPGKHPRIRNWVVDASSDPATIERWWGRWPNANIGIATGRGLTVLDADGAEGLEELASLVAANAVLPPTLMGRTGNGVHLYFVTPADAGLRSRARGKLHVRSAGGFVVAPPSLHVSGRTYEWIRDDPPAEMPGWLLDWVAAGGGPAGSARRPDGLSALGPRPAWLGNARGHSGKTATPQTSWLLAAVATQWTPHEQARLAAALTAIPADAYDSWLRVGMALHGLGWERADGSSVGFDLWDTWSASCKDKYARNACEEKWRSFGKTSENQLTIATVYALARASGWSDIREIKEPENPQKPNKINGNHALPEALTQQTEGNPLIELNNRFAVIGDLGGKCLVMSMVPSKVDETIQVPSFQTFRAFGERFANRYITVAKADKDGNAVEEIKQLGTHWLKWSHRRSYNGLDLDPAAGPELPGGVMNLWTGFHAPAGSAASWDRLRWHIAHVLAAGDADSADYIFRFAAWCVQHPGERAEVALVCRGGKGSGKGTFANALKQLFGQHGLQIFNSKHLVGSFNAHLRNCLLLFSDEAFWAGDKQGESVLKGLITEPALMIEQKGVDATPWKNRLHVIMSANAEWVVPASHDERRYAVFDVSEDKIGDRKYFADLHHELRNGGLAVMLRDLLEVDLGEWHPRHVVETAALAEQKALSLNPLREWWESLLQEGRLPGASADHPETAPAFALMSTAKEAVPRLRDISAAALGRFLRGEGCLGLHTARGNTWRFPELVKARARWVSKYRTWTWRNELQGWGA